MTGNAKFDRRVRVSPLLRLLMLAAILLRIAAAPMPANARDGAVLQERFQSTQTEGEITKDESGRVTVKFSRGNRIDLWNDTTGPIVVVGWDRDFIEASAVSDRGPEEVRARIGRGFLGNTIHLNAGYSDRHDKDFFASPLDEISKIESRVKQSVERVWSRRSEILDRDQKATSSGREESVRSRGKTLPAQPTAPPPVLFEPPPPDVQAATAVRPGEIFLEVRVPRYAELELIRVFRSEVLVYDVATPVIVEGDRSTIRLGRVGAASVRTRSGNVEIEGAGGTVDVVTTSGGILVRNSGGNVRALSVSGQIQVHCAGGRIDASNTDGPIVLTGVAGDVSANATYSNLLVRGPLRTGGRYELKSMSGSVQLEAPERIKGFSATLTSYSGVIESDFALKSVTAPPSTAETTGNSRRLTGRYGDGSAQITLDSFEGTVKLVKMVAGSFADCR